jgi:hypothetical protein
MVSAVNLTNLSLTFKLLTDAICTKQFTDDRDILEVSGLLLKTMGLAYENRVRLIQWKRDAPADQFLKATTGLALKGLAYEERKLYRKLNFSQEEKAYEDTIEYVDTVLEACKRYESVLRLVTDSMKIGVKLAFEGHN